MLTVTITNTIMSKTRNAGGGGGIPPSNTVAPVISGTAVVGQTLSSTTGTWIGTPIPTYTYQWYRAANPISGATSSTYTLVQADATFSVTCVVTATNPAGIASATSNALTIIDADAQAFFTASGLTGTTNQSAINKLVVDMKGYGIWTKMKAIYPIVGGTASLHKWNLKDPRDLDAAFRLTFNGGMTHSATGILFGGVNGYADTFLYPSIYSTNHLSFYSRTLTVGTQIEMGCWDGAGYTMLQMRSAANYVSGNPGTIIVNFTTTTDARGFWIGSRRANNDREVYRNGVSQATVTTNDTTTLPNFKTYIGARNNQNTSFELPTSKECAFASIGDGLTDTEAANFYTAVQTYNTTLGRSIGPQTVSDPDAQAFVTAANIDDQVQAQAVNQLTIDMKAANIWTKMKAIYPFVGGTAASHKWNLKDPRDLDAAFRLVFNGGWTHSSTGATPNGTNGYADTFLTPSTSLLQNSSHISYYSRTQSNGTEVEIGSATGPNGATDGGSLLEIRTSNITYYRVNSLATYITYVDADSRAFYIGNRTASNVVNGWRNNTKVATGTTTSFTLSTRTFWIGGFNQNGSAFYSTKQCAFSSIGDGLTDTEAANFYNMVQTFNTTLNRQV